MTLVRFHLTAPTPGGWGKPPRPLRCTPLRRLADTEAAVVRLPVTMEAAYDGDGVALVWLEDTPPGQAWEIEELPSELGQFAGIKRTVLVPPAAEGVVLEYTDLLEVDPSTLEPSPEALEGWTAVLAEVAGHAAAAFASALAADASATRAEGEADRAEEYADEVQEATFRASLDPLDPDLVILQFASYLTDPDDELIVYIPLAAP